MLASSELCAVSVAGPVAGDDLGVTLPHEHLHCDGRVYLSDTPATLSPAKDWSPQESQRCREAPLDFPDNLDMRDPETALSELRHFRQAGGQTIVELTTFGLSPDRSVLRALAENSGVNVIAGTGFYVEESLPAVARSLDVDRLAQMMIDDIEQGDPINGARAGIIGEIGTSDPIGPTERRVVEAAALAHLATGCPISFHFVAGLRMVPEVFAILSGAGVTDLSRIVISHSDDVLDTKLHRSIMELGAYVEYDTFGNEGFKNQSGNTMPSDDQRIAAVAELLSWGCGDRILLSHDVCMKMFWSRFGGFGYTKLLDDLGPTFALHGVEKPDLRRFFVENPRRLLCFSPGSELSQPEAS